MSKRTKHTPVALVTGASSGLGSAITTAFGQAGYLVAAGCLDDLQGAEQVAKDCAPGSFAVQADVSDPGAVDELAEAVRSRTGRLDVLVVNAGITEDALLVKATDESWDRQLSVNLKSAFLLSRAFARDMKRSGGGHIITISSNSGLSGRKAQAAYSASKAGLVGLTLSLAREYAAWNIRANVVAPPYMPTSMGEAAGAARAAALKESLLNTLGDPAEVAGSCCGLRVPTV